MRGGDISMYVCTLINKLIRSKKVFMYSKYQPHVARPLLWFPCYQNGCCSLLVGSGYARLIMFGHKAHIHTYVPMYIRMHIPSYT